MHRQVILVLLEVIIMELIK